jgi:transcription elongation factor GreA
MTQYKISESKKRELETELTERMNVIRPLIRDRVEEARSLGDLKENAEYHTSRDEQAKNEDRIAEIQEVLKYAVIVKAPIGGTADLGSKVIVQKSGDSTTKEYQLVSKEEADITQNKLSIESPLGQKLVGSKAGDTIVNQGPSGDVSYTVVTVS